MYKNKQRNKQTNKQTNKYAKYKTKYINLKMNQNGRGEMNIVILNSPNPSYRPDNVNDKIRLELDKLGKVYDYYFKFGSPETDFILEDLFFENAAQDINNQFAKLDKVFVVCFEEACPYGLYFADNFPHLCQAIVCFPFRLYTKESLERYIWKYQEKDGWKKYVSQKYGLDKYLLNINNKRLNKVQQNKNNEDNKEELIVLYSIMNYNIRKQYEKIPTKFKIPTCLFTRLDLSVATIIETNFERKAIANMKEIASKDDALLTAMMWHFARYQYDEDLIKLNSDSDNLRIQYIMADLQEMSELDLLDKVKIMINKC